MIIIQLFNSLFGVRLVFCMPSHPNILSTTSVKPHYTVSQNKRRPLYCDNFLRCYLTLLIFGRNIPEIISKKSSILDTWIDKTRCDGL